MKFAESQLVSMHAMVYAVLTQPYTPHVHVVYGYHTPWHAYAHTVYNELSSYAYTKRGSFDLYGCCGTTFGKMIVAKLYSEQFSAALHVLPTKYYYATTNYTVILSAKGCE